MFIKIVAGVFGHRDDKDRVVPIRAGEFCEVDDKVGARLIAKKVAVEAVLVDEIPAGVNVEGTDEEPEVEFPGTDEEPEATFPDFDDDMTRAELDAIALQMGATPEEVSGAKNKAAVIALLEELKADFEADGQAPVLDAAAAIQ